MKPSRLQSFFRRLLVVVVLSVACTATPLPQPPFDAGSMSLIQDEQGTRLVGEPGAVTAPADAIELRVRVVDDSALGRGPIAPDGSFDISIPGASIGSVHYLELVLPADEVFLGAVQSSTPPDVVEVDPGPDSDDDGWPDVDDCQPGDGSMGGSMCACLPAEICTNGFDDDCNDTIDDGCTTCRSDADCSAGQTCTMGVCL